MPIHVQTISDRQQAACLLDPLRVRILERAQEPVSASRIAEALELPRQRVSYHVKELARARLLRRAGSRRRRNLIEHRYLASARSYVLCPDTLGALKADFAHVEDPLSAARLMGLLARSQREVGQVVTEAAAREQRVSTLSMHAEVRFESAAQRAAFADALERAVADVIEQHSAAFTRDDGTPGEGRPYRLALGVHPIPHERPRP